MKFCILLLFTLISFNSTAAGEYDDIIHQIIPRGDIPNAELKLLQRHLSLQTLILESILEIQLSGGKIANINQASQSLHQAILLAANAKTLQLGDRLKDDVMAILKTTVSPNRLKEKIRLVSKFVTHNIAQKGVNMSAYTRRFGMQIGLFYMAMVQLDYTLPLILLANGEYALGATLLATPISSTTTAVFAAAKSAIKYKHMIKTLGIKESLKFFNIFRSMKKFIDKNIYVSNYLIDFNVMGKKILVNTQGSNILSRFLQRLGLNKDVNYKTLTKFLQENDLYRGFTRRIINSTDSDFVKTLRILDKIQRANDITIIFKLRAKFGKKINIISGFPNIEPYTNWAIRTAHLDNIDDLLMELNKIPKHMPPKVFDKIWRNDILPHLTRSFGDYLSIAHYRGFRNLIKIYNKDLRPSIIASNAYEIDQKLMNKLKDYIYKSLIPLNSCSVPYRLKEFKTAPLL